MYYQNPIPSLDDEETSNTVCLVYHFSEPVTRKEAADSIRHYLKDNVIQEEQIKLCEPTALRYSLPQPDVHSYVNIMLEKERCMMIEINQTFSDYEMEELTNTITSKTQEFLKRMSDDSECMNETQRINIITEAIHAFQVSHDKLAGFKFKIRDVRSITMI